MVDHTDILIRNTEVTDIAAMLTIAHNNYPKSEEQEFIFDLINLLDKEDIKNFYTLLVKEQVVGFAMLSPVTVPQTIGFQLAWLNITPKFKGNKLGILLRGFLRDEAKRLEPAAKFICGKCLPHLKNYYENTGSIFYGTEGNELLYHKLL